MNLFRMKKRFRFFAEISNFCKFVTNFLGLVLSEVNFLDIFTIDSVMSRFRFSISPVQVRELTLYALLRPMPHIVIPVLGLSFWTITKDGAREREIICFGMFK